MARQDIKAGGAYVELYVRNNRFVKGLRNAQRRLHSFGSTLTRVGAGFSAIGGSALGAFTAAGKVFADTGDSLQKMSARTGVAVETLSALEFAAQQSGASINDVGGAIQKMNRRLGRITAGQGTGSQVKAMEELGLSIDEISKMNPEQRFMALADAISNYGDDAAAAGLAQRAFGTGVDQLLPLFSGGAAGIRELMQEAQDLGVVMSTEDADAAAALTDAFGRVQSTMKAVTQQIGAAVAPAMEAMANRVAQVVSRVIEFVRNNREMVATAAKIAAVVAGVGAVLIGFGTAALGVAAGIGGIIAVVGGAITAVGTLAGAVVALVNPFTAVLAVMGAAGAAWIAYSETGQNAMDALFQYVGNAVDALKQILLPAFDGIKDALVGGDLQLAAEIAFTAMRLAAATAVEGIANMMNSVLGGAIAGIGAKVLGGDFAGAFQDAMGLINNSWRYLVGAMTQVFAKAANTILDSFQSMTKFVTDKIKSLPGGETFLKGLDTVTGGNLNPNSMIDGARAGIRALEFGAETIQAGAAGRMVNQGVTGQKAAADLTSGLKDELKRLREEAAELAGRNRPGSTRPDLEKVTVDNVGTGGNPLGGGGAGQVIGSFNAFGALAAGRGGSIQQDIKAMVQLLRQQVKEGVITRREFSAELRKLGYWHP